MLLRLSSLLSVLSTAAFAAPQVVADVGPVHSLVARVMQGAGEPTLLIPPGISPHGHSMRPSEAAALEGADVVFWVGEALEPWLHDAIGTLTDSDAEIVELLDVPGTVTRMHDDAHEGQDDGDSGHADEGHAEADHAEDGHDHHGLDPHAWLDPENAGLWLYAIAEALSRRDPDNAVIYAANAEDAQAEIAALDAEIAAELAPVEDRGFVVFHDGYGYFEDHFQMHAIGAISVSDATPPSAATVADLRAEVVASDAVCVFSEPQFNAGLVATLTDGTQARTGVLDPLGAVIPPGPALYPTLMRNLAGSLAECLGG